MDEQTIVINRTTMTLYRSVLELLATRSFDEISVNDLCQHAMVSRSTFYAYFADKYALVTFFIRRERDQLNLGNCLEDNVLMYLNQILKNKVIYKNILIAQANRELTKMIVEQTSGSISNYFSQENFSKDERDVISIYISYGIVGTVMWWVENDCLLETTTLANYLSEVIYSKRSDTAF